MSRFSRIFPTASIGSYLVALTAVIALPLIAFVIFLMIRLEAQQRDILNSETEEDARMIARSIDRELADAATTLRLIANSPELQGGNLQAFHGRTQRSLSGTSRFIILADAQGNQKLNTRVGFGEKLTSVSDRQGMKTVLEERRAVVSNIIFGATSQRWVFNILLPLPPDYAQAGAVLILTQNADDLQRLISTESLPAGWSVAVLDQTGNVVTSTAARPGERGPFAPGAVELMSGVSGTIEDVGGNPRQMYGYARIAESSWKVVVWGPISSAQANIIATSRDLIIGSIALLVFGMVITYLVGRQLRVPIRQIAEMAERIGHGEIVSPIETRITEANQIAVALSNASFDRSQAEDRIHLIMHELVHRTKNIMTLIQAMMRQLARRETSMEDFQRAIGERLQGLGKSIEMLAQEQWQGVPIHRVVALHLETFAETLNRVDVIGPDIALRAEAVQNLGLVLHELATNSVKYGALSVPDGRVDLNWVISREDDPRLTITWEERGGPSVVEPKATGFGTTIINRHAAASFSGHVQLDYRPQGVRWSLTGPLRMFERPAADGPKDGV
jgi:two-component sensor histidine kinase